jgi:regulatory protein
VRRLKAERLLDDSRFAAAFARSRLAGRSFGSLRIGAELRRRGVGREPIAAGLSQALADVPQEDVVDEVIRRLARQSRGQPPERRLRRIWSALLRRGFPAALVRERLEVLKPAWRDMLESPAFEAPSDETEGPSERRRDEGD